MAALTGGSTDRLGHFRCMPVTVAGVDSIVSRTGWSHELGYEIYPLGSDRALELWDAVVEAGRPYDMMITGPNIARAVESGITDTNLATGMKVNALEANPRLVDLDGADFIGRDALLAVRDRGAARRQVGLLGPDRRLPRLESEWALRQNGEQVGATRWVTFSPRLGRAIAIGLVRADLAEPGVELVLDHPGRRRSGRGHRAAVRRAFRRRRLTVSATLTEELLIGGERLPAAEGRTFEVVNPASARPLATVAEAGVEDVNRAVAAAARAYETWGALSPVTRGPDDAPVRERGRGARRGAGPARVPQRRHADRRRPRAALDDRRRDPLLRGRRGQVLRPHDPRRTRRRGAHVPRADRRGRPDHAVELPAEHRQLEGRARAGGGQHGRPQAGQPDAALGAALRRAGRRGRPARGRPERRPRARGHRSATRWSSTRTWARSASRARPPSAPRSRGGPRRRSSG